MARRKRSGSSRLIADRADLFDQLPDDIVVYILTRHGSSASSPSDFINVSITCKRFNRLALQPLVLSKAGAKTFAVKAKNWSASAERFLKLGAEAGNAEATYTLGMIRFYCLQNRLAGASLMAKAAIKLHAPALYSLAVIQFNGSASKGGRDLRAGVALCARAAVLGHIDAVRELGHCLQDGYGIPQNFSQGRRLLVKASAMELLASSLTSKLTWPQQKQPPLLHPSYDHPAVCALMGATTAETPFLSDFECSVSPPGVHPANRFLSEWFQTGYGLLGNGLRLCSHRGCGRPETRPYEFRRCAVCSKVNYCSRGCQALDWKLRHKTHCFPPEYWPEGVLDDNIGVMIENEEFHNVAISD